jgi:hypothetical protein
LERRFGVPVNSVIANPPMYWSTTIILATSAVLALSGRTWAQTTSVSPTGRPTNVDEWQATDLSILDFVTDGYDLVSVISPSSHTRIYFLAKPGKIVKCREEVTPNGLPPMLPGQVGTSVPTSPPTPGQTGNVIAAPSPLPGQAGTFIPPPDVSGFRTEFECALLLRGASRQ